jgi:hypothetical protein
LYGESLTTVPTYVVAVHPVVILLPRRPPACTYESLQQSALVNINGTQIILTRSKMAGESHHIHHCESSMTHPPQRSASQVVRVGMLMSCLIRWIQGSLSVGIFIFGLPQDPNCFVMTPGMAIDNHRIIIVGSAADALGCAMWKCSLFGRAWVLVYMFPMNQSFVVDDSTQITYHTELALPVQVVHIYSISTPRSPSDPHLMLMGPVITNPGQCLGLVDANSPDLDNVMLI